jgi:hypothetical protein
VHVHRDHLPIAGDGPSFALAGVDLRPIDALDDDALVAAIAASEGVVVLAEGDEPLPGTIEALAQRAWTVCTDGNGARHSAREQRVAVLVLIAAIQHVFGEPAALGLIAGRQGPLLAVVPVSRMRRSPAKRPCYSPHRQRDRVGTARPPGNNPRRCPHIEIEAPVVPVAARGGDLVPGDAE